VIEREVKCVTCNHQWTSKVDNPRCSKCGSRDVEDVRIEPAVEDIRDEMVQPPSPGELNFSKIYIALEEGKTPIDLVKLGLCNPDEALETWNEYEELKTKTLEITGESILEERVIYLVDQIWGLEDGLQRLSEISTAREEKNSNTIDILKNQISNLQTDVQRLLNTSNDREKKYTVDQNDMLLIIDGLEKRVYELHSNICPNCGQQAVVVFARCRNCGSNLERYP
jgi:hypothetical protein